MISKELFSFIGNLFGHDQASYIKSILIALMKGTANKLELFRGGTILDNLLFTAPSLSLTLEIEEIKEKVIKLL